MHVDGQSAATAGGAWIFADTGSSHKREPVCARSSSRSGGAPDIVREWVAPRPVFRIGTQRRGSPRPGPPRLGPTWPKSTGSLLAAVCDPQALQRNLHCGIRRVPAAAARHRTRRGLHEHCRQRLRDNLLARRHRGPIGRRYTRAMARDTGTRRSQSAFLPRSRAAGWRSSAVTAVERRGA